MKKLLGWCLGIVLLTVAGSVMAAEKLDIDAVTKVVESVSNPEIDYNGVNNDYSNGFFSNSFEKGSRSLYSSNGYEYPYVSREDLNPSIPLSTSKEIYPERPYSSFGETPHTSLPSAFETELLPVSMFITVLYSLESKKQSLSSFGYLYPSKVSPRPPRAHANSEPKLSPRLSTSI